MQRTHGRGGIMIVAILYLALLITAVGGAILTGACFVILGIPLLINRILYTRRMNNLPDDADDGIVTEELGPRADVTGGILLLLALLPLMPVVVCHEMLEQKTSLPRILA